MKYTSTCCKAALILFFVLLVSTTAGVDSRTDRVGYGIRLVAQSISESAEALGIESVETREALTIAEDRKRDIGERSKALTAIAAFSDPKEIPIIRFINLLSNQETRNLHADCVACLGRVMQSPDPRVYGPAEKALFNILNNSRSVIQARIDAITILWMTTRSPKAYLRHCTQVIKKRAVPPLIIRAICDSFVHLSTIGSSDELVSALLAAYDVNRTSRDCRIELCLGINSIVNPIGRNVKIEPQTTRDLHELAQTEFRNSKNSPKLRVFGAMLAQPNMPLTKETVQCAKDLVSVPSTPKTLREYAQRLLSVREQSK